MRMFCSTNYWDYLHRDVDFVVELHPGTSPISMTSHRMASMELQELKV